MLKISSIIFVVVALLTLVKAQDRAECDCRFDVFFAEYFCTCKNVAVFNNSYSLSLKINHDGSLNNSDVTNVEYERSTIQTNSRLLWTLFDNLRDSRLIRVGLENLTSFDECLKLQRIEIIGNKFSTISSGIFKKCSNLSSLLLYSNSIQEVKDAAFDGLASLKILDLSSNSIHEISRATFKSLSSLQYLNLDENQIEFIPDGAFDNHDQLLYLTMRSNKIAEIHPFSLQGLYNLLALSLQNNKLTSIHPYTFRDLETLDSLSLSNNRIRKLDNFLGKSRNVTSIDLTGNQIDSIHPLFFRNISSVHLQIENNICVDMNFASLNGSSAESLPELQKCFENYNATTAPADNAKRCKFYRHELLGYTCELSGINYDGNESFQIIGYHLSGLQDVHVTTVIFANSSLRKIPDEIVQKFLSVENLIARNVSLKVADKETIKNCGGLKSVDLSDNKISSLNDEAFEGCASLNSINLANNHITSLPAKLFSNNLNLESIFLDRNKIARIDPCNNVIRFELKSLKLLSLKWNICINNSFRHQILHLLFNQIVFNDVKICYGFWFL